MRRIRRDRPEKPDTPEASSLNEEKARYIRKYETELSNDPINKVRINTLTSGLRVTPADIANYWWTLAMADARELMPKVACRHCWGIDFQYQYTKYEFQQRKKAHLKSMMKLPEEQRVPFDEEGGDDYLRVRKPNSACPECSGAGIYDPAALDYDKMSLGAQLLFDGIIKHKDGSVEVKLRNRTQALVNLQRLLGLEVERKMVQIRTFDPSQLTDEELTQEAQRLIKEVEGSSIDLTEEPSLADFEKTLKDLSS